MADVPNAPDDAAAIEARLRAGQRLAWGPGEVKVAICGSCRHKTPGFAACKAFPSSIPDEILVGDFDHRNPWPNAAAPEDDGVRYEPIGA